MAENESPTKVENEKSGAHEGESEDFLSLESLDSLIAKEDPDFAKSLDDIGPEPEQDIEIYNEGLQLEYTLADEVKLWKESPGFRKKLATVLPFLPHIAFKLKLKRTVARLKWLKWKAQAIHNIKNAGPLLLAWSKNTVLDGLHEFGHFSKLKKLAFLGLLVMSGAGGFIVYRAATKGFLPHPEDLFISSLSEWSQNQYRYNPREDVESFYESQRLTQNILLMKKMVVNLRRSSESGENPMGAFEFFVEGAANEVIVEIKDREPEVEDIFLRAIEEMNFDQVSSGEGKRHLCEVLRKDVNKILTKGYVRKVFIKTAIVKP